MRRQVVASLRAGESTTRIAERLLDLDNPRVRLPQHVRALRDAARAGDRGLFEDAVDQWSSRIRRLGSGPGRRAGPFTIRSATQQLVTDLRRAGPEGVQRAVGRWVLERARHQARVVARTETIAAYNTSLRQSLDTKPHVIGYRWTLSPSHPAPDECDILAHQDLDGLGPGGYRPENVPDLPVHPNDGCFLVPIIDQHHFSRRRALARGEPEPPRPWESGTRQTGAEWLATRPTDYQRQLLGPGRFGHFAVDPTRVITPTGAIRPLHVIEGRPPPQRRLGPRIDAVPIIAADRETFVRPFPSVPTET